MEFGRTRSSWRFVVVGSDLNRRCRWVRQCVDGNKRRQLSLVSWRVAVVERRSAYSGSRRHCVWWTTRSEEHYQHWSLLRVVKLICLTVLFFEHLWNLGTLIRRGLTSVFGLSLSWTILHVYGVCIIVCYVCFYKNYRKLIDVWRVFLILKNATNTWQWLFGDFDHQSKFYPDRIRGFVLSFPRMRDFTHLKCLLGYFLGSWDHLQPRRPHEFWRKIGLHQKTQFSATFSELQSLMSWCHSLL